MIKQLKHYWKKIIGVIAVVAVFAGGFNDIKQFALDLWSGISPKPKISLSHTSKGDIHAGDIIILSYQAPKTGHLSLWNIDAAIGTAELLLPLTGMQTLTLTSNIQQASLKLKAKQGIGTDQFILLWTAKNKPKHLPHRHYDNLVEFEAALNLLEAKGGLLKKRLNVPIF